jgi:ankyrin repeat protein
MVLDTRKWQDFLLACRRPKLFAALCCQWQQQQPQNAKAPFISVQQVQAFDALFQRGLMAAARNDLVQPRNAWPLQYLNITSSQLLVLLIQHGANPLERDVRGATLLHWAAGTGNWETCRILLQRQGLLLDTPCHRDGATCLHWAAAGVNAREFGLGGHVDVCRELLQLAGGESKRYVNQLTKDGNSPLMWAAWSGSLDVCKLLVRQGANPTVANRNGCTVAHWASSGGSLECCRYLHHTVGVDFSVPNCGGNTPLTHAVAFGRVQVVEWLRSSCNNNENDSIAASLAQEFVDWTNGDERRQQVLSLFEDWYGGDDSFKHYYDGGENFEDILSSS